jgi:1,4-dihydroxy-2-naphthoyl-CoA hydrolase
MTIPSADEFNAMMKGYDRLYGLEFLEISEEHVRARVLVRDELKQPLGLIHGGVYASLAESVTSIATAVVVVQEGNMATGMSNATNFLRPITAGYIHAHAKRLHRGRTTWVWDVSMSDDADRICAITRMTIAVRPVPSAQAAGAP